MQKSSAQSVPQGQQRQSTAPYRPLARTPLRARGPGQEPVPNRSSDVAYAPAVSELGKTFRGKHVCKNADLVTLFPQFAELLV